MSAGPIGRLEFRGATANVRFQRRESQTAAIERLHRTVFAGQASPISVLPFFDRQLSHRPAGLVQLNELPPSTTVQMLKHEFSGYGPVLAAAVNPAAHRDCPAYGFVLFQTYNDAFRLKTRAHYANMFLYPQVDPMDVMPCFSGNPEAAPDFGVVIYDVPRARTEDGKRFGVVRSFMEFPGDDDRKTVYIFFDRPEDARGAFGTLKGEGLAVDLLNQNALAVGAGRLASGALPVEWQPLLLYVKNPSPDLGSHALRE
jgi:hypothetical protein